ncbi:MAG TPA: FG-GAP-like repeat-containing protein, partial [Polyangia bacterium]|nr:FG-GAP-like repeat-containing protein [Polyangia bacterium]
IHRCPKSRTQDGKARPVMMDALGSGDNVDGVCLDGKRLFEKSGTPLEYYTELADFSVISRTSDFKTFKVVTKTGETRFYASRDDARVAFSGQTAIWALDRVQDQWGNFFELHYYPDFADNGLRIKQIKYTGHVTQTGTQDVDPFYNVDFFYEARSDVRTTRFRKTTMLAKTRLTAIQTARGAYTLTYLPDSVGMPSRLQQIGYSAPVQPIPPPPAVPIVKTLKPLSFQWNQSSVSSFWSATSANPGYALPAEIPAGRGLKGTQFIDLDGDGRSDFVVGRSSATALERLSYRNNGHGWDGATFAHLPVDLVDSNDVPTGARFADMDGDGLPDLIVDNGDVRCDSPTSCMICSSSQAGCSTGPAHHASPAVWINRLSDLHQWSYDASFEQRPTSGDFHGDIFFFPKVLSQPDFVADVDGDGRADVVRTFSTVGMGGSFLSVITLLNKPAGWQLFTRLDLPGGSGFSNNPFRFQDVNRDGLPDLAKQDFFVYTDGHLEADDGVYINQGPTKNAAGDIVQVGFAAQTGHVHTPGGGAAPLSLAHSPATGDIDGDGMHDFMAYYPTHDTDTGNIDREEHRAGIALADGTGLGFDDPSATTYMATVEQFTPKELPDEGIFLPGDYGWSLIDANGDGLADLLRNHAERFDGPHEHKGGGQTLINTGTNWVDLGGATEWQVPVFGIPVPVVPDPQILQNESTFVDVNGDGLVDLVQAAIGGNPAKTYLNTFTPPVITGFPKALSTLGTTVSYVPITTEGAQAGAAPTYKDNGEVAFGLVRSSMPMRVVNGVTEDNGAGSANITTYQYEDLRASAFFYGAQGFAKVTTTEHATGLVTETKYAQAYPYTSLPTSVVRSNQGPVSRTTTIYCTRNIDRQHPDFCLQNPQLPQQYPPKSTFFVRPVSIDDIAFLRSTFPETSPTSTVETTTSYDYDDLGNPTLTTIDIVGAGEGYHKETANKYGTPGSLEQRRGKVTETVVTTTKTAGLASPAITHKTELVYGTFFGALSLAKTRVEPGVADAELHTVYDYDKFGNATVVTNCASDFDSCSTTAPDTLPFRTVRTSYDPAELDVPVNYSVGRFPTKVTNALGQVETTVFDPLLGVVVQKTGPNGIRTCLGYDPFGMQTSETLRCGSDHPLTTTMSRYLPKARPPAGPCPADVCPGPLNLTKTVSVTRPPTGSPTWVFSDAYGRAIENETLGFGGDIIRTITEYDGQGRVHRVSKPFGSADPPHFTTSIYDPLGRATTVTQDLGQLGDPITGATNASVVVSTTHQGFTTRTDRIVNGELRRKEETKNAVGKTSLVKSYNGDPNDPASALTLSFVFDVEGNPTDTIDTLGNTTHVDYDARGRKISNSDADMGLWEYHYDGFGDLRVQIDPNARAIGQSTGMTYDKLGRMVSKTDAQGASEWIYDTAPGAGTGKLAAMIGPVDGRLAGECLHPFTNQSVGKRPVRSYQYNEFGDVQNASECTDGETFATDYAYDDFGRQRFVTYPEVKGSRLSVEYHYTSLGYLHYLSEVATGAVYWATTGVNAAGQVTSEYTRNGVDTISQFEPATGWLLARASAAYGDASKMIQDWAYQFDEAGNLRRRLRMDE